MPTYEYGCAACGHEWEQMQRIVEPPIDVCPKCGKTEAHRLISRGTNFILKGGGWYSDLYASSKGAPKKTEAADGASSSSDTTSKPGKPSSEAKTADTKAAAPAATASPASTSSSS